jgi:hypothetical protein
VRPLLPGTPGSLVVVTSRMVLAGLAVCEGARVLNLDVLDADGARQLLMARLGADRLAAEPAAVAEIVQLCGHLPLALAVAATHAATTGTTLAALASQLADGGEKLESLALGEAVADVRAVFSWSLQRLSAPAARMFWHLGLHAGAEISADAAASLAGLPTRHARAAMRELTDAGLAAARAPVGYLLHDLVRAYAAELAQVRGACEECEAAVSRVRHHCLHPLRAARHATGAPTVAGGQSDSRLRSLYGPDSQSRGTVRFEAEDAPGAEKAYRENRARML